MGLEGAPNVQTTMRFRGENILHLELDLPNRATRDYEGPSVAPRLQYRYSHSYVYNTHVTPSDILECNCVT